MTDRGGKVSAIKYVRQGIDSVSLVSAALKWSKLVKKINKIKLSKWGRDEEILVWIEYRIERERLNQFYWL